MFAILRALGLFVTDLFKSRCRLEAENLLLRHQLSISEARHKRGHTPPRPVMLTKVPDYVAYECRVNSVAPAPGPKGTESWR
jgi:hypothetical protein